MIVRARTAWLAAGLVIVTLAALPAFFLWSMFRAPGHATAPLPALSTSPYLNTKPGISYVGDAACADCHREQEQAYRQHPMGRSLFRAAEAPALEDYAAQSNPFQVGPLRFQVSRRGAKVTHREWCEDAKGTVVAERREEMEYAIGSGSQARSYMFERDGFLFESPITWFSQKSAWDVSPGYEKSQAHFHRPIEPRCLYCHAQDAKSLPHAINRYHDGVFSQPAIGCERCHGPGELHVARRNQGLAPAGRDWSIVNPRDLTPALRDAVCEQCHLIGGIIPRRGRTQDEYRPGLPLHEYVSIFMPPPDSDDSKRINGHVEEMHGSACFQKSVGRLGCTSCHDPHRKPGPSAKVSFYQQRCRQCHVATGAQASADGVKAPDCALPGAQRREANDNCMSCHMPRLPSAVTHLAVTDHRVPRHGERAGRMPAAAPSGALVAFHRDMLSESEQELERDLALALVEQALSAGPQEGRPHVQRALRLLDQAAARDPNDVPILEARGFALFTQGRAEEGFKVLEDLLAKHPEREQTLAWAAHVAETIGRLDAAEDHFRRLTRLAPYSPTNHQRLAQVLVKRREWTRAQEAAQAAIKLNPFDPQLRWLLAGIHVQTGNRAAAQTEFDVLGVVDSAYQEKVRQRFAEQIQGMK